MTRLSESCVSLEPDATLARSLAASQPTSHQHHHHQHDSAAASSAWLDSDIVPYLMSPRQLHRKGASVATSRHGQHRIGNTIASMTRQRHYTMTNIASVAPSPALTQGLDTNFPDQSSDSEVHYRSGSKAWGVPLQPTARLGYIFTYITGLDSMWTCHHHNVMRHFVEQAKSYS
jgi:hypothetical protein